MGFATMFLVRCKKDSKSDEELDIQVYSKLMALDSKLGMTAAERLFYCVKFTKRLDFIKVWIQRFELS